MYEHLGIAAVLLILAIAGGMGKDASPACCGTSVAVGPAILVFR